MQAASEVSPVGQAYIPIALVVEDDVILRMNLSEHLREVGFHVLEAANGDEARQIMDAVEMVDVVVSDVQMSFPTDGIELARWMGQRYPAIPVILTSGSSGVATSGSWKVGPNVTAFLPKVYQLDDMERLVRKQVRMIDSSTK